MYVYDHKYPICFDNDKENSLTGDICHHVRGSFIATEMKLNQFPDLRM